RIQRRGGDQRIAGHIVYHLSVDMVQAAVYAQARTLGRAADLFTDTLVTYPADFIAIPLCKHKRSLPFLLLTGLAFLAADMLIVVTDALAQIRLRPAHVADIGGHCADLLLVYALYGYAVL